MNPQEEIQFIVENTGGGCWHDYDDYPDGTMGGWYTKCKKCEWIHAHEDHSNPSPHSLDDLVRLAEKNGFDTIMFDKYLTHSNSCDLVHSSVPVQVGSTKADALRSALVKAVEGRK